MAGENPAPRVTRFGVFELDVRAGELRKGGVKVRLQEQPLQILTLLLEQPGEIVTREAICQKLWPSGTFVDFDHSLNAAVMRLREALDDSADNPRFVETVPRRGYRFIAPVEGRTPADVPEAAPSASTIPARRKLWPIVAGMLAVLLLLAVPVTLNLGGLRDRLFPSAGPASQIDSIAVLPLKNLMNDPEQDYFVEGMHEALTTELTKISGLKVISRTSAMGYKNTDKPTPQIARELGVAGLIDGSVLREGEQVRITVQLIHGPTDRHLWAQTFDRDLRGILALSSDVAQSIARQIEIAVTPAEQTRLARTHPVNPEAYEAYLRGRYQFGRRTPDGNARAIRFYEQALEKEPTYAPAYAGLATVYAWQGISARDPKVQKAREAALKALALDDTLAEAHVSLGMIRFWFDWDWSAAEMHFKRAVELNPSSPAARGMYQIYLHAMGRFHEALRENTRARELDPLSAWVQVQEGNILYYLGNYDGALEKWQAALDLSPDAPDAHAYQGWAYLQKGMYKEAAAAARNAEKLWASDPDVLGVAGYVYGRAGKRNEAQRVLNQLRQISKRESYPINSPHAFVYAGLGEKDQAFARLEKAHQEREYFLALLKVAPEVDPLRSDRRFQDLLRRMNFPQ